MSKATQSSVQTPAPAGAASPAVLERYREAIDEELRLQLAERPLPLYTMLRYHLGWVDAEGRPAGDSTGKALRPALCLLACEGVGGQWRCALPAAAALELVHNFSLIHDDIQDGDRRRRHRPTVWALWGKSQALNAGDVMRELASLAILRARQAGADDRQVLSATQLLGQATLEMIEGQFLDLSYEGRPDVTVGDYLAMIARKTGALLSCSLEVGALFGDAAPPIIEIMARAGLELGLVFQIRDDILGVWGDSAVTGKPQANDIRRRKRSLPAIHALEHSRGAAAQTLCAIYAKPSLRPADVARVLQAMDSVGTLAYCQALAKAHCQRALAHLRKARLRPDIQADFEELARFLLTRDR